MYHMYICYAGWGGVPSCIICICDMMDGGVYLHVCFIYVMQRMGVCTHEYIVYAW